MITMWEVFWILVAGGLAIVWACIALLGRRLRNYFSAPFAYGLSMVFAAGLSLLFSVCLMGIAFLCNFKGEVAGWGALLYSVVFLGQALVAVIGGGMLVVGFIKGFIVAKVP